MLPRVLRRGQTAGRLGEPHAFAAEGGAEIEDLEVAVRTRGIRREAVGHEGPPFLRGAGKSDAP